MRRSPRLRDGQLATLSAIASVPAMTLLWPDAAAELLEGVAALLKDDPSAACAPGSPGSREPLPGRPLAAWGQGRAAIGR